MVRRGAALGLLIILLVVTAIGLGVAIPRATHTVREAKEDQLRFILSEYRRASQRFFDRQGRYPLSLAEMADPATGSRYLRRVYKDPFSGGMEWGILLNATGTIFHSLSSEFRKDFQK